MRSLMRFLSVVVILTVLSVPQPSQAQLMGPGQAPGLNAALTKLFGATTAFSSKADVRMIEQGKGESVSMTMNFALLDGKMRAEVDMNQIKSKELPPEAMANLKQMGMDKMIGILRPDRKPPGTLVIYPSLQAYAEVPLSAEDVNELNQQVKIDKTKLGKETIAGHTCEKTKVVVTPAKGEKQEAIIWYATDLKEFPLQMQMAQGSGTVTILYRDVQFAKPDAKIFEPPAGFARHDSIEKLMQSAMMKMLGPK